MKRNVVKWPTLEELFSAIEMATTPEEKLAQQKRVDMLYPVCPQCQHRMQGCLCNCGYVHSTIVRGLRGRRS
jgi:hypothetical protein